MKQRHRTVLYVLGGLLVLSAIGMAMAGAHLAGYDPSQRSPLVDAPSPDWSMPLATGEGSEAGDRIALRALRGKVVLLDFWASWCGPCRQSIPALNQVHERYGDRIALYGVNVEGRMPNARLRAAHRSFGAAFPTLQDVDGEAQRLYSVSSIPTLVLIDQNGVVRWVQSGVPNPEDVGERIDELLRVDR